MILPVIWLFLLDRTLTIVLVDYKMVMAFLEWRYLGNYRKAGGRDGTLQQPKLRPHGEEKQW